MMPYIDDCPEILSFTADQIDIDRGTSTMRELDPYDRWIRWWCRDPSGTVIDPIVELLREQCSGKLGDGIERDVMEDRQKIG